MIHVSTGILLQNERVFFAKREPNAPSYGGLWELPGGKREEGETDEQALVRELREELNIEATLEPGEFRLDLTPVVTPRHVITQHFFVVRTWVGTPGPRDRNGVSRGIAWVSVEDLHNFNGAIPLNVAVLKLWRSWRAFALAVTPGT